MILPERNFESVFAYTGVKNILGGCNQKVATLIAVFSFEEERRTPVLITRLFYFLQLQGTPKPSDLFAKQKNRLPSLAIC